jgi:hypothetical protein
MKGIVNFYNYKYIIIYFAIILCIIEYCIFLPYKTIDIFKFKYISYCLNY